MIDPITRYDLIKLRMREAQEYARQGVFARQVSRTNPKPLLGAIAPLRSSRRLTLREGQPSSVLPRLDADCCVAC